MTYDNIKSHKKPGLSRRYIFRKSTGGVKLTPAPSLFRVKSRTGSLLERFYSFILNITAQVWGVVVGVTTIMDKIFEKNSSFRVK